MESFLPRLMNLPVPSTKIPNKKKKMRCQDGEKKDTQKPNELG